MTSLKTFHLLFVLIAMMAADLFGGWAIHEHASAPQTSMLVWGAMSFLVGLALAAYALWIVHTLERAHV